MRNLLSVFGLFAIFLALLCDFNTPVYAQSEDELLLQKYHASIVDASKPLTKSGIDTTLIPLIKSNPDLQWDSQSRVLLVTWTNTSFFDNKIDSTINTASDMWVTAVPVLKVLMGQYVSETTNPELRMKQLLGMWPNVERSRFVEVWVDTNTIFRPCPDPEIWDCKCDTVFPQNVSLEHKQWFENEVNNKYGPDGYPWTRQGYTYDWGGITKFGVSEFVIRKGSPVKIKSVNTPSTIYTTNK